MKKTGKKILSGARGLWLRKPETKIKESARVYKRKGRRRTVMPEE